MAPQLPSLDAGSSASSSTAPGKVSATPLRLGLPIGEPKALTASGGLVVAQGSLPARAVLPRPRPNGSGFRVNTSAVGGAASGPLYKTALGPMVRDGLVDLVDNSQDDSCNIYLITAADELHRRIPRLREGCRVNHFPGMTDVCEKVGFARVLRQLAPLCPRLGAFIPETWILPEDIGAVVDVMERANPPETFIVKPEYGLQGDGIFMVRSAQDLRIGLGSRRQVSGSGSQGRLTVCQRYIEKPLIFDGNKFDFRLYLVLTNVSPPEAYLCREGIARFCTTPYAAPSAANIRVRTAHLTNYNLNKKSREFAHSDSASPAADASKRLLSTTMRQLRERCGLDENLLWQRLMEISSLLLVALAPVLASTVAQYLPNGEISGSSRCYQVLGLDVLLDEDHWPWLLEVNSSPSMDIEAAVPLDDAERQALQQRNVSPPPAQSPQATKDLGKTVPRAKLKSSPPKRSQTLQQRGRSDSPPNAANPLRLPARAANVGSLARQGARSPQSSGDAPSHPPRNLVALAEAGKAQMAASSSQGPSPCEGGDASSSTVPPLTLGLQRSSSNGKIKVPPVPKVKTKVKRQKSAPVVKQEEEAPIRRFTDPWDGYRPSKLRERKAFPEVCCCTELAVPHRHVTCPVDERVKSFLITNVVRLLMGAGNDQIMIPVDLGAEAFRVMRVLHQCVGLADRLRGAIPKGGGFGGSALRRILQGSAEVAPRGGGGRLSMHDLDLITSRHRSVCQRPPGRQHYADLSILDMISLLLAITNKCCERSEESSKPALDKLEWLLLAISDAPSRSGINHTVSVTDLASQ